jgi:hypothetical protein
VTNNFPMALPRKGVTIGITVNLDNYENLRIEVSGEAADAAEAGELVEFLDRLPEPGPLPTLSGRLQRGVPGRGLAACSSAAGPCREARGSAVRARQRNRGSRRTIRRKASTIGDRGPRR